MDITWRDTIEPRTCVPEEGRGEWLDRHGVPPETAELTVTASAREWDAAGASLSSDGTVKPLVVLQDALRVEANRRAAAGDFGPYIFGPAELAAAAERRRQAALDAEAKQPATRPPVLDALEAHRQAVARDKEAQQQAERDAEVNRQAARDAEVKRQATRPPVLELPQPATPESESFLRRFLRRHVIVPLAGFGLAFVCVTLQRAGRPDPAPARSPLHTRSDPYSFSGEAPQAYFGRGIDYWNSQDYDRAIGVFREGAARGDADCMVMLGVASLDGKGMPYDPETAVDWYRKAADRGHANAMTRLAMAYERGGGVKQDRTIALEWARKAAASGDPDGEKFVRLLTSGR